MQHLANSATIPCANTVHPAAIDCKSCCRLTRLLLQG